jgi:hypothetical protein
MKILHIIGALVCAAVIGGSIVIGMMALRPKNVSLYANCSHVWAFEPQADITAYDLARIVSIVRPGLGGGMHRLCEKPGDVFPEDLRRHLAEVRP